MDIGHYLDLIERFPAVNAVANVILIVLASKIYGEVKRTNDRLLKLETWQVLHESAYETLRQTVMNRK